MGKKLLKTHKVSFQDDNMDYAWYAIVCQFNWERKAAENIEKRFESLGAKDKFGEIIVPLVEFKEVNAKGKEVVKSRNVLESGYIFIRMILTNETWNIVRQTTGVAGWLNMDGRPSEIPSDNITSIKHQMGLVTSEVVEFDGTIGNVIEITEGAMAGLEATVTEISENKEHIKVEAMNGIVIEVKSNQVKVV